MEELTIQEVEVVTGGNPLVVGFSIVTGFVGSFNAFTEFGVGLGFGIYDATH
ncbi:hypothetical protein [Alteromonas halophila]|uniref:Class IIb bacteriocin, lactobin A/cerein 7B family n=1 Tax=Alteromonas halophila TaxID=516698 RepID=A0A918MUP2_9ALTE|nr:hypothetical protein [Alteromonas halophila]GGW74684.1 hypothetical protein GCM10007391_03380 [Alteromonas halophila]